MRKAGAFHVISGLAVGGAESMLTSLLMAEREAFPDTPQRVVSLSSGGVNAAKLRSAGVVVTELGMRPNRPPGWELFRLARLMWLEKPAIVQSWMYHADLAATLALYWSGRRSETRLIWGLRCSNMNTSEYGLRLRAVVSACARLSKLPDAIVSNSVAGQDFHETLGYPRKKFIVIPNGIDIDRFRPDPELRRTARYELGIPADAPVVAHVARVDPMKDHTCFIDAIARIPHVHGLLIGQGTERFPARQKIHQLGRRNDVPRLLNAADIIVSSSAFGEGFSNAIAEGMATGLPAVVTDTGDARFLVGDTGVVVPVRDPNALAQGILEILEASEDTLQKRKASARTRIEDNFSLRRAVAAFRSLYNDL